LHYSDKRNIALSLANHVEYTPRVLLRLETDKTDGLTDGQTSDSYITLTARHGQYNK